MFATTAANWTEHIL